MKKLLVFIAFLGFLATSTSAVLAIDTLNYFLPPNAPPVHISNGEVFQSISQGGGYFIIQKSTDPSYYEKFSFNNSYIYHHEDTTWATEQGNVSCFSGGEAYFNLYDSSFGSSGNVCNAYNTLRPASGMKWVPRQMEVGSCFTSTGTVVGFNKTTKQCCEAPFTGPEGGHTMCLEYQGCIEFPNGIVSDNGIALKITSGAGSGETFYYDKRVGWIGFSREGGASCAYVVDPLPHDPSLTNCLKVECQAAEVLPVKDNLICTDFTLTQSITHGTSAPAPSPSENGQALAASSRQEIGNLELTSDSLPNFSLMERNLYLGLNRLLPQSLRRTLNLDSTPLTTQVKHYVLDATEEEPPVKIPETKVDLPSWWTRLLGSTKIACGFFNTCSPPEKMNIQVAAAIPEAPDYKVGCFEGDLASENSPVNQIKPIETEFITPANIITKIISEVRDFINGIWQLITITETKVALINKSRGKLPGGQSFNEQTSYLNYAIPGELVPKEENAPLGGQAEYEVDKDYDVGPGSDRLNYQEEIARQRYCMERCSLRPQGISIQGFDPLCPSCSF